MKRKNTEITKLIYKTIKDNPNITMSRLERIIGTNPHYLKEHCELLEYFDLIKIDRSNNTKKLRILK